MHLRLAVAGLAVVLLGWGVMTDSRTSIMIAVLIGVVGNVFSGTSRRDR